MNAITVIAERKIEEALAEGAFDNLPGQGRPLELEDLSHIPADMRMAYTILKNSGCLDETTSRPGTMKELMAAMPEEGRVHGKMRRLNLMMDRVRTAEAAIMPMRAKGGRDKPEKIDDSPYYEKVLRKI